jgi:hypothetical protein
VSPCCVSTCACMRVCMHVRVRPCVVPLPRALRVGCTWGRDRPPCRWCPSEWDFGKLVFLKLANIFVLYIVKRSARNNNDRNCTLENFETCECPLFGMGYQFFFLMVTDMTVSRVAGLWSARACPLSALHVLALVYPRAVDAGLWWWADRQHE